MTDRPSSPPTSRPSSGRSGWLGLPPVGAGRRRHPPTSSVAAATCCPWISSPRPSPSSRACSFTAGFMHLAGNMLLPMGLREQRGGCARARPVRPLLRTVRRGGGAGAGGGHRRQRRRGGRARADGGRERRHRRGARRLHGAVPAGEGAHPSFPIFIFIRLVYVPARLLHRATGSSSSSRSAFLGSEEGVASPSRRTWAASWRGSPLVEVMAPRQGLAGAAREGGDPPALPPSRGRRQDRNRTDPGCLTGFAFPRCA